MNFYKLSIISMIVILLICLAIIAFLISTSDKKNVYPPHISECPDYYVKQEDGKCKDVKGVATNEACMSVDFNDSNAFPNKNNSGLGSNGAFCERKTWAKDCGVNWDGLTNNENVCYSTN
jgi:hypothetical protein